ncbi:MAG: hypothetical protein HYW23_04500 [Candidatus Aenigmarchaeota archaeon]|nr:hypothetical protein [Candidatus Aenigmarchaeota archaeon]
MAEQEPHQAENVTKDISDIKKLLMALVEEKNLDVKRDEKFSASKEFDEFKDIAGRLERRFGAVENRIASLENDVSVLQGNLMGMESNLSRVGLSNIKRKFDLLQSEIDSLNSTKDDGRVEELIEIVKELQIEMASAEAANDSNQFTEIINRLVFLESRMAALETMLEKIPKNVPIVVE